MFTIAWIPVCVVNAAHCRSGRKETGSIHFRRDESAVGPALRAPVRSDGQDERRVRTVEEVVPEIAEPVGDGLVQGVGPGVAPEAVEAQS